MFVGFFCLVARKATAGVPGKFQNFVELLVEFVDTQVNDTFHGHEQAHRAARAHHLLLGAPVQLHGPAAGRPAAADRRTGVGIEHLKVVPSTDLNVTFGMSLTVFVLMIFYSIKIKGLGGFIWELLTHPFGKWMMPFNLLLNLIEHLARPISLALRLFGNLFAGEMIFLLLALLGGSFAIGSLGGSAACSASWSSALRVGHVPHPCDHAAGLHIHDADDRVPVAGARDITDLFVSYRFCSEE